MNTDYNYLDLMTKANTSIKCSKGGLSIRPKEGTFAPTTLKKVARIGQFLACQADSKENRENLVVLQDKLIRESQGNQAVIAKVKELALHAGGAVSPVISIEDKVKPLEVVKMGIVIEQENLLTNFAMLSAAKQLLMHGTPVVVNREFLIAHRLQLLKLQIPCQYFHQKEGDLSVIIPGSGKNPLDFGFDNKKLKESSLIQLPPLCSTGVAKDLDHLLLKETSEKKFLRVVETHGHGSPSDSGREGKIAGLPLNVYFEVNHVLKKKGAVFGVLNSCFAGGGNINTIKQSLFPLLVTSSSEMPTRSAEKDPSFNDILNYVCNSIQKGELQLDETALFSDEKVHQVLSHMNRTMSPQLVMPANEPLAITPPTKLQQTFLRLNRSIETAPIVLEGKGGFISPGGTKNHLLVDVTASENDIQSLTNQTLSLLKLSNSHVKKGIFIEKLTCPSTLFVGDFQQVMIFASKTEKMLVFSVKDSSDQLQYFACIFNSQNPSIYNVPLDNALFAYYSSFGQTIGKKGKEGEDLLFEFQNAFFGKGFLEPIHEIYATLVRASLYEHGSVGRKIYLETFQNQLKDYLLPDTQLNFIQMAAKNLGLPIFAHSAKEILTPELIKRIWRRKEESTLEFLKQSDRLETLIHQRDTNNQTPLSWALRTDQMDLFDFILEKMKILDDSAFIEACKKETPKIAERILQAGTTPLKEAPPIVILKGLLNALQFKNHQMVDYLLQNASFDAITSQAIHFLILHSHTKDLETFLNTHCKDNIERSLAEPLRSSITAKDVAAVKILLEHGASPNQPNDEGKLPLELLSESPFSNEQIEICELLINKGAQSLDASLSNAIELKNIPLMQSLIKAGANLHAIHNDSGKTLFQLAMSSDELMDAVLSSCSLGQLENEEWQLHPLLLALRAQDLNLATRLIQMKGMKPNLNKLMNQYIGTTLTQAKLEMFEWFFFQQGSDSAKAWSEIRPSAIIFCTREIVQAVENIIHPEPDTPTNLLKAALVGYRIYNDNFDKWSKAILKGDEKPLFESYYGPEQEKLDMIHYYLDQVTDFEESGISLLNLFAQTPNFEIKNHLINAMIKHCKVEALKPLYQAVQDGDIDFIKNFDIDLISEAWKYLPLSFQLIFLLNLPSKELVDAILDQIEHAHLYKIDINTRSQILHQLWFYCGDDPLMKSKVIAWATEEEVERLNLKL